MKLKISITRRELSNNAPGKIESEEAEQLLPEHARLIAEIINKLLMQNGKDNNHAN